ncbi:MAG: tetratricopeptide repeat protein [Calditrichaeota bacterium]|nr:MAG: tetratricopeptide repeat protein [Calditrichota bacterium]
MSFLSKRNSLNFYKNKKLGLGKKRLDALEKIGITKISELKARLQNEDEKDEIEKIIPAKYLKRIIAPFPNRMFYSSTLIVKTVSILLPIISIITFIDFVYIKITKSNPPVLLAEETIEKIGNQVTISFLENKANFNNSTKFINSLYDSLFSLEAKRLNITDKELQNAINNWILEIRNPYEKGLIEFHKQNYKQASSLFVQSIESSKSKLSEKYLNLGNSETLQYKFNSAVKAYKNAIKLNANNADAHRSLGKIFYKLRNYTNALTYFTKYDSINPLSFGNINDLAMTYADFGVQTDDISLIEKAKFLYNKLLQVDSTGKDTTYNNIGVLYGQLGEIDSALYYFKKAPSLYGACCNAGFCFSIKAYTDSVNKTRFLDSAIYYTNKAIFLNPDYAIAYNNLGTTYQQKRDTSLAIINYKKAIIIDPNLPSSYYNLGDLLLSTGQIDSAKIIYTIGTRKDSTFMGNFVGLIKYHIVQENFTNAARLINKVEPKLIDSMTEGVDSDGKNFGEVLLNNLTKNHPKQLGRAYQDKELKLAIDRLRKHIN